jgi:hypothetical protein
LSPDGAPSWGLDYTIYVRRESLLHTSFGFGSVTLRKYFDAGWGAPSFGLRLVEVPSGFNMRLVTGLELGVAVPLGERIWFHLAVTGLCQYFIPSFYGYSLRLSFTYCVPMSNAEGVSQHSEQPVVQNPDGL